MEAKEMIAQELAKDYKVHEHRSCTICKTKDALSCWGELAQAILDLRYTCKACGGSGQSQEVVGYHGKCPSCHGTGQGGKVLGVLDENQGLPKNPFNNELSSKGYKPIVAYGLAITDMILQGWRKVKE